MTTGDEQQPEIRHSEQRGGSVPGEQEAAEKGPWAARAQSGVVPSQLGGSDAPEEMLDDDPELGSSALGQTAQSGEPATQTGIDQSAGDRADATQQGGAETSDEGEPDLKDAAAGPRQADLDSAG